MKILEVKNLSTRFKLIRHTVRAVDDVSFDIEDREILAIAGESGCGKSATALSILKLIQPPGEIDSASKILFEGRNLLDLSEDRMNEIRGKSISMIFQEPSASFNPLFTVGSQIAETLRIHLKMRKTEALARASELLESVRIPNPERRSTDYPFQLSGGMLQRAMIALAMSCSPRILLADEPTTALDPTTQIQILDLIGERSVASGMSVVFVTHDLELLQGFADRILVMYAGKVFEISPAKELLSRPLHPYAADLLAAIPRRGVFKEEKRLFTIPGRVPDPGNRPDGCPYHPRCSRALEKCRREEPPLFSKENRSVRCWLHG